MDDSVMKNKRLQQLHDLLAAKQRALVAQLRTSLGEQRTEDVRMSFELAQDDGDKSVEEHKRHVQASVQSIKSEQLDLIEQALEKLAAGTYGICAECGSEIPLQRLEIQSFASYCVACQEEIDKMTKRDKIRNDEIESTHDTTYDYLPDE
jgi:DnaK suppressor protein